MVAPSDLNELGNAVMDFVRSRDCKCGLKRATRPCEDRAWSRIPKGDQA